MEVFNCSPEWPICLFDFTVKQKCPNMFVLRMLEPLTFFIKDNYFYCNTKHQPT
jgi:hypothetical protein